MFLVEFCYRIRHFTKILKSAKIAQNAIAAVKAFFQLFYRIRQLWMKKQLEGFSRSPISNPFVKVELVPFLAALGPIFAQNLVMTRKLLVVRAHRRLNHISHRIHYRIRHLFENFKFSKIA